MRIVYFIILFSFVCNYAKNQGLTNSLANISHENLLDNPWFTVNQRGQSSYTDSGNGKYTVDRWYLLGNTTGTATINVLNKGISFTVSNDAVFDRFLQRIDNPFLYGKEVTISLIIDSVIYSARCTVPSAKASSWQSIFMHLSNGFTIELAVVPSVVTTYDFDLSIHGPKDNTAHIIEAVKLELGSISTLAMDTAPNYATELLKCQRYFLRIKATAASNWMLFCMVWANSSMNYIINTPAEMRLVPTVSVSNIANFIICKGASTNSRKTGTNINCFGKIGNSIMGTINVSETDLALGDMYVIKAGSADDYINFSADL